MPLVFCSWGFPVPFLNDFVGGDEKKEASVPSVGLEIYLKSNYCIRCNASTSLSP